MGALAVGDQILAARDHRMVVCWCLVRCWCLAERRRYRSQRDPTGQRAAALYELPAASSFRTHRFPPSKNDTTTKSRPRGRECTRPCQIWPVLMSRGAHEHWLAVFEAPTWFAVFLPRGASEPIIRKLNQAAFATAGTPSVQERLNVVEIA